MNLLRTLLRLAVAGGMFVLFATLSSAASPPTVEQWSAWELELSGPQDGNPFVEVRFSAEFSNGAKTVEVDGFYDGEGVYRVRFMPDRIGAWRYVTKSNRWPLTGKTGSFIVTPAVKGNHGPVHVRNTYHFAYVDGTPFKQMGTTIYNWLDAPEDVQEQTLKTLAASPFNKVRVLITQQPVSYRKEFAPPRWPFVGKPPHEWDFTRFNPDFFRHYEQRIAQLRDLGVEADVMTAMSGTSSRASAPIAMSGGRWPMSMISSARKPRPTGTASARSSSGAIPTTIFARFTTVR
jgi:hypothetical protein